MVNKKTLVYSVDENYIKELDIITSKIAYLNVTLVTDFSSAKEVLTDCDYELIIIDLSKRSIKTELQLGEIAKSSSGTIAIIYLLNQQAFDELDNVKQIKPNTCLVKPINYFQLLVNLEMININVEKDVILEGSLIKKNLTIREKNIYEYVIKGISTNDIACILDISPKTVSLHRSNILRKARVKNTIELMNVVNS